MVSFSIQLRECLMMKSQKLMRWVVRTALISALSLWLAPVQAAEEPWVPKEKETAESLKARTSPMSRPKAIGQYYEATVPDTLDLAERMRLSLNAITRCVAGPPANPFPPTRYLCNHFIDVGRYPPKVLRNVDIYGKYLLGARLARIATGSEENREVDDDWRGAWLEWQKINPIMSGVEGARRLEWLTFNLMDEPEPNKSAWVRLARRAVARLSEAAVPWKDGAWIVMGNSPPDDGFPNMEAAMTTPEQLARLKEKAKTEHPTGWTATGNTWTVQGLCAVYRAIEDPAALGLAGKIARYLKDYAEIIAPDGRLLAGHKHEWPVVHWHHSFQAAMACAEYGVAARDREFLDFADAVYRHVMTFCNREVGFAPEYCYGMLPRQQDEDNTEACCSAGLILLALWLTQGGFVDYWDDIDRYIRNHITTLQMTDTRWIYQIPENRSRWPDPDPQVEATIAPLVGNFGGWATANEWHVPKYGPGIMTCCVGNSTRAFYYVWDKMLDFSEGRLRMHLMLNRASRWADLNSHRPYEGRFEIKLKQDCRQMLVRAPEWVASGSGEITCTVGGEPRPLTWSGRYLELGAGKAGDNFKLLFPIRTRQVQTQIGRRPYTLTIKGTTVIAIDPPGKRIPLYQRDYYRSNRAPLKEVTRFVKD